MNRPQNQTDVSRLQWLTLARLGKPIAEWLVWVALGAAVYALTDAFDQKIAEYAFGATGWPRALCVAVVIGATGQLGYQILMISRNPAQQASEDDGDGARARAVDPDVWRSRMKLLQRLGIFFLPLLYLYVIPLMGFFVVTPFFVLCMLLLLEVKSPVALLAVTCAVYVILLLIFTRLFYVALPVGRIPFFYDLNNAIIVLTRTGL